MDYAEKVAVQNYHKSRMGKSDSYVQGWKNSQSQLKRFEILTEFGDFSDCAVLDLGCGLGDFKAYLDSRFARVEYCGVDMIDEFIRTATNRYENSVRTSFIQADFLQGSLPESDIIVVSGSLNYRTDNLNHPFEIIEKMWHASRVGVAFNLLDSTTFESGALLCGYDPHTVMTFCRSLTDSSELVIGELSDDFTVFLRR